MTRYEETATSRNEVIYDILDMIEEYNDSEESGDIIDFVKLSYPDLSREFIGHVVRFEKEVQKVPLDKEITHVRVKGENEICAVLEVLSDSYRIQHKITHVMRGDNERVVPANKIVEKYYEGHAWYSGTESEEDKMD